MAVDVAAACFDPLTGAAYPASSFYASIMDSQSASEKCLEHSRVFLFYASFLQKWQKKSVVRIWQVYTLDAAITERIVYCVSSEKRHEGVPLANK